MSILLKDLPKEDLPRERLQKYGVKNLSNAELIAILLRTGTHEKSVKTLAENILSKYESIRDMRDLSIPELTKIKGMGLAKSTNLIAALELGKRVYEEESISREIKIHNSVDAYRYFASLIKDERQEHFLAIYLDNHQRYITHKIPFNTFFIYSPLSVYHNLFNYSLFF